METNRFSPFGSVLLLVICLTVEALIEKPKGPSFAIEGDKFVATCTVENPTDHISFTKPDNSPIIETDFDENRLNISSKKEGGFRTLTFTLNPVKMKDGTILEEMSCLSGRSGVSFNIKVISKASVPNVSVHPTSVEATKDSDIRFNCTAETMTNSKVDGITVKWRKSDITSETLTGNDKYGIETGTVNTPANVFSILTVKNLIASDTAMYYCIANLNFGGREFEENSYYAHGRITKVVWDDGKDIQYQEIESKAGEDVSIICTINGYPKPELKWEKESTLITANTDGRYVFSNTSTGESYFENNKFTIKNLNFGDRALYKCMGVFANITKGITKVITKEYRLRVRDPLGALWPTIGILAETVLLAIIIGLYELYKKNKKTKKQKQGDHRDDTDGVKTSEKSPLVTNAPVVSYTKDVRSRINVGTSDA